MNSDQAKEYVRLQMADYLSMKGINPNKPFTCLNPQHSDGHPSMTLDKHRNKVHCFSCGADYDTFDLIGFDYGLSGRDLFLKAYEIFHLDVEGAGPAAGSRQPIPSPARQQGQTATMQRPEAGRISQAAAAAPAELQPAEDLTEYFKKCAARLSENDYLQKRGISTETAQRFGIGYDPCCPIKGAGTWQAVIIPTGPDSYVARNTDPEADKRYRYRKRGNVQIFNMEALNADAPVFLVEGEIDALSIEEVGGKAAALGSTANVNKFLQLLADQKPAHPLIIAMDGDKSGLEASRTLSDGLRGLQVSYEVVNISESLGGPKDANEALLKDKARFTEFVQTAAAIEERQRQEEKDAYESTSAACYMSMFHEAIQASRTAPYYETQFPNVDKLLDGGLYAGLYVIGAISSLGKTTFCLQVADQIAQAGKDVLIFSLEMSRYELMAKSISRLSLLEDMRENGSTSSAKTTRGILTGSRYDRYSEAEKDLILQAEADYFEFADHIFIQEGMGDIGVKEVRAAVDKHIRLTGRKPLVLLDYVQILAPADPRATDKQNTDKAVLELKRISRDYSIPVLAISSFNRENYSAPVNMAAFKESGALEYSSDVLIALQYAGMDHQEGETEKARDQRVREMLRENIQKGKKGLPLMIQVKILKNRNGAKGDTQLEYYPMFNYFTEPLEVSKEEEDWAVMASSER